MAENSNTPKWGPPYCSFRTLLNLIQNMEQDQGLPPQIDRSFLTGSEGSKTQLISSLKSLGLIQQDGRVTPVLTELVNKPETRKQNFRALLEQYYVEPTRLGKANATQNQLVQAFDQYQATGDTRRKAIA